MHIQELAGLWRHPSMRVLSEVRLDLPPVPGDQVIIEHLAEVLPRSLRKLEISGSNENPGSLQPLLRALPRLTELELLGRLPDLEMGHSKIHRIVISGQGYNSASPRALGLLSPDLFPAVRSLVLRRAGSYDNPLGSFARSKWAKVVDHFHLEESTGFGLPMAMEAAESFARGFKKRKLPKLEITGIPIPLPVRAALTPYCEQLICPSHAVVLDDATTHVTHANKPEWGKGKIVGRANGKLEVKFGKEVKVFKADAPFLVPAD
jgi:hypothetical protein